MRWLSPIFLLTTCLLLALPLNGRHGSFPDRLSLSPDGEGRRIFLPPDSSEDLQQAGRDLQRILSHLTEAEYQLIPYSARTSARRGLFLGDTRQARQLWRSFPADSFFPQDDLILWQNQGQLVLAGRDDLGSAFAVYHFLEKVLGVHWFWPGAIGEDLPSGHPQTLPPLRQKIRPSFGSRLLWAPGGPEIPLWRIRNRMRQNIDHSHSLYRWVPPALFDERPDFFPLVNGERYRPPPGRAAILYQPDLGNPDLPAFVASAIDAFWRENPQRRSASLSINDSMNYGTSPETMAWVDPKAWFRQVPQLTDLIFQFNNRVAEALTALGWSDRLVGAYAYNVAEHPPSFPIHPMVVPMLTADRSQWIHADFKAEDKAVIRGWSEKVEGTFGLYEYAYGHPFSLPRIIQQWLGESLQFAHAAGARAYFAEAPPLFAFDGDKHWFLMQLLWDIDQEPGAIRDHFFQRFFRSAAGPMRAFYDEAAIAWQSQPGPARWIKHYRDENHLHLLTRHRIGVMRGLLQQAEEASRKDPRAHERVQIVSEAFRLTEHLFDLFELRQQLSFPGASLPEAGDFEPALQMLREHAEARRKARAQMTRLLENNPESSAWERQNNISMSFSDPSSNWVWRLLEEGLDPGALTEETLESLENPALARLVRLHQAGRVPAWESLPELMPDTAFVQAGQTGRVETDVGPLPLQPGWLWQGRPSEFLRGEVLPPLRPGEAGRVRLSGGLHSVLRYGLPIEPGRSYRIQIEVRGRISPDNRSRLNAYHIDTQNRIQSVGVSHRLPTGDHSQFSTITLLWEAPEDAALLYLRFIAQRQEPEDWLEFRTISVKAF
jgi:hypothetical protein